MSMIAKLVVLALVAVVMVSMLRESPMILTEAERAEGKTLGGMAS